MIPAALGAVLLALASIDQLHIKSAQSQPSEAEGQTAHYQRNRAMNVNSGSSGLGALLHHGATQ